MPKYLTIGENLQIVRGDGCGFLPGESPNDLESAQRRVSAWIEQNGAHSDVDEARRWLAAAEQNLKLYGRRTNCGIDWTSIGSASSVRLGGRSSDISKNTKRSYATKWV